MASNIYGAIGLVGGSNGYVDTIKDSVIADGDMCIAIVGGATDTAYIYTFDDSSASAESSPDVIKPDDAAGNGRWILCSLQVTDLITTGDLTVGNDLDVTASLTCADLDIGSSTLVDGIIDDDTMATASATTLSTSESIKTYVDTEVAGLTISYDLIAGLAHRSKFTYVSSTQFTIGAGRYHHNGTSEQIVKWDSTLTITDIAGDTEWHYVYIDDSAVVVAGTNVLTATEILVSAAPPVWDEDQLAWYGDGSGTAETKDRCIFAYYVNSSGHLDQWWHSGDYVQYDESVESLADADPDTDYSTAVTLHAPAFCTGAMAGFDCYANSSAAASLYYYRTTGSSGTGLLVGRSLRVSPDRAEHNSVNTLKVVCSSGQSIDVKVDVSDSDNRLGVETLGYFLPEGM